MVRRKRNKIHGLHLPSGAWCTDPAILQDKAIYFFKSLFCTKEVVQSGPQPSNISPLSEEGWRALTKPVSKNEVHRAVISGDEVL